MSPTTLIILDTLLAIARWVLMNVILKGIVARWMAKQIETAAGRALAPTDRKLAIKLHYLEYHPGKTPRHCDLGACAML